MTFSLGRDAIIYGGSDALTKLIAFVAFPLLASALSPVAFGALELVLTTSMLVGLLVNCGLSNAVQRYYWDNETREEDRPLIVSTGFLILGSLGLIAVLLGIFFVPWLSQVAEVRGVPLGWIALTAGIGLMALNQYQSYILDITRLHFAPWRFLFYALLSRAVGLAMAVSAVLWLGWGVDGLLAVYAGAALVLLPVGLWLIRKDLKFAFSRRWAFRLVQFGYPFIFAGMAYWIFGSMDRWMLAVMEGVDETGVYSVAMRFAGVVMFFSTAFAQAWSPYAIKLRRDYPSAYRQYYVLVLMSLLVFMFSIAGGGALFSRTLIELLLPETYAAAAMPFAVLCFGMVMQATTQVTAIGISLEEKSLLLARVAWLAATCNFILNLVLIPLLGAVGAAWATSISYLVLTAVYLAFTQRLHPLPMSWNRLGAIMVFGVLMFAVAFWGGADSMSWKAAGLNLGVLASFVWVAWRLIPFRRMKIGTG